MASPDRGYRFHRSATPQSYMAVRPSIAAWSRQLLQQGIMESASGWVFLSHLFTVLKKDLPRDRLIIDLSHLNTFVQPLRFRVVMVSQVRVHLRQGV